MRFLGHPKYQFLCVSKRIDSQNQDFEALIRHELLLLELSSQFTPTHHLLNSMIIRAGILVVALVSAIKVCQLNIKINRSRKPSTSRDENKKATSQQEWIEKKNAESEESHVRSREKEEPQVEICKCKSAEQLDSRRPFFSLQDVSEIDLLNNVVKEKEKKSWNLEVRLIELCGLKDQQSRIALLRKQLMGKASDISMLSGTIHKLKAEMETLYDEVKLNRSAGQQLESAKLSVTELQKKRELCAEQMEAQLMLLEEQVFEIFSQGEYKGHTKVDKKLKPRTDVELKAFKLKRLNIELQLEKRELVFKLDAAKAKIAELSCMTEQKLVAKFQEEISRLKRANNNLLQEIDKLQKDRFSFLEELIYQKWLNKCLTFELEDYRSSGPKKIKPILSSKLYFRSDSNSSGISSVDSDELTNTTTSSSSSNDAKKKSGGLIPSIKRWGRSKGNSFSNASESRIPQSKPGLVRRSSTSSVPSSTVGLRNRADSDTGILFSSKNREAPALKSPGRPANRRTRRVSFNDSFNSIRYIYEDRPQSDEEISENSHKLSESSNDCSSSTFERTKDELPSSTVQADKFEGKKAEILISTHVQIHEATGEPNHQDLGTETQVFGRRQSDPAEIIGSGMPDGADGDPGTGKFCDQVVNLTVGLLTLVLLLVLIYFRFVSAFKHLLLLI